MSGHNQSIAELRREYSRDALDLESVDKDPFQQFHEWFNEALKAEVPEANAMTLSTVDEAGKPNGRIVLLKELDQTGFVFYTNYNSRKGAELANNPHAAIIFFWVELERQVRIQGAVEKVEEVTSENYFKSRPIGSQKGAWASPQSEPIQNKHLLTKNIQEIEKQYPDEDIPRPDHWGGYRVIPSAVEFWQGRPNRLHDRILYYCNNNEWFIQRLAP